MKRTLATGQTCVGELRLTPLDVAVDLKALDLPVTLPASFASVGLVSDGVTWLVEGTRRR